LITCIGVAAGGLQQSFELLVADEVVCERTILGPEFFVGGLALLGVPGRVGTAVARMGIGRE